MPAVNILKFGTSSPADIEPLNKLKEAGYDPSEVIGLVGKTEGNGCVNDFSRTLSAAVWEPQLPKDAVTIFSGGTEGVLSPHVNFIVKEKDGRNTGLVAAVGHTRKLEPHEVGTLEHAREVASAVSRLLEENGISSDQVGLVLIKCPLLTSGKIETIRAAGKVPLTTDTYESMARSRYASAVGIAVALGEVAEGEVETAIKSESCWSTIASCSSGAELDDCHILILASSSEPGPFKILSTHMQDAIDAQAIMQLLDQVKQDHGKVVQVFAKAEADPTGHVRGTRHTMNTDSDIHSTRHARAAVGGLVAGLTGDTHVYISGGAEGQGPPGGGSLCIVYNCSS